MDEKVAIDSSLRSISAPTKSPTAELKEQSTIHTFLKVLVRKRRVRESERGGGGQEVSHCRDGGNSPVPV